MAGYDPKRPRSTQGAGLVGLPGDPVPAATAGSGSPGPVPQTVDNDSGSAPGPTRRVLPRAAPPLDRRLPPMALAGGVIGLVLLLVAWRRWQRRG